MRRRLEVSVGVALVATASLATQAAAGPVGSGRAVIAIFPMTAPGIEGFTSGNAAAMTKKLHRVISGESGYLTVPRAALRRAIEEGAAPSSSRDETARELAAKARRLESEAATAKARFDGSKVAVDLAPDTHEGRATHEMFKAEEEYKRLEVEAKAAREKADAARAVEQSRLSGASCVDDACRASIAKRVGAAKVLRATFAADGGDCALKISFYDIASQFNDLTLRVNQACNMDGLKAAIDKVAPQLKRREDAGFKTYELDLADGMAIKNPKTDRTGVLSVHAYAQGDPNESIEVFVNGVSKGRLSQGRLQTTIPYGRYIVVLKPASPLFVARRFDFDLSTNAVRIPAAGRVALEPTYGAVEFDLVDGPWRLRTATTQLIAKETNRVRPGRVPVQFYLGTEPMGEISFDIGPSETRVIRVTSRPLTEEEIGSKQTFSTIRKWTSLGLAAAFGGVGAERFLSAQSTQADLDVARTALDAATNQADYQNLRGDVLRLEDQRSGAQNLAVGMLATAGAFALWSAVEWLFLGPERGRFVVEGYEVVPINDIAPEEDAPEEIPGGPR